MYLARLGLAGFRSFDQVEIPLREDITVLAGENNGGKSSVMDSIRLVTTPLDGKRDLYFDADDVHRGAAVNHVTLTATYGGEGLALHGDAYDFTTREATYSLTYVPPPPGRQRGSTSWQAGRTQTNDPDPTPEARKGIRHLYLPPLRDAQRELASRQGSRVQGVVERLLREPAERDVFVDAMRAHFTAISKVSPLPAAVAAVQGPLSDLTSGAREQNAALGFGDPSLASITRGLRLLMNEAGLDPQELAESGLGYANLLFIATVLAQLVDAAEADLTILLVEEPEAHLHPQLQTVLIEHLKEEAIKSRERVSDTEWLGRIQVVVTTHSPHIAVGCTVEDLVILQRRQVLSTSSPEQKAEPDEPDKKNAPRYISTSVAVSDLDLSAKDLRKLQQYLNATRNTLVFGPRVMLVEGISEAILLPVFAQQLLDDPRNLRRFTGAALIPIDGVDFEPYLRLLLTVGPGGTRIAQRVAVITDGDFGKCARPKDLTDLIASLGAGSDARVFANHTSLEPELLLTSSKNEDLIRQAWREMRPRAWQEDWQKIDGADAEQRAQTFKEQGDAARIRKGDFAQELLAVAVDAKQPLDVPGYLADALRWIAAEADDR
ncbi:recombination protein F [Actinomadura madurae]|nr:recombination protein F [Actinomadura madurae]